MINISPNCYAKFIDRAWSDECTKSVEDLKELKIIQMNQVFTPEGDPALMPLGPEPCAQCLG